MSRQVVELSAHRSDRRPDRRPERTQRKVLDAALAELRQTSYSQLTMRAVATRAGVSPASAYTYFPSKSVLIASVYLGLLRNLPTHTDPARPTAERVSATMREMALLATEEPELTAACGTALMSDDLAVQPITNEIGVELTNRLRAALGPGWPSSVTSTLVMTFSGALMTARFMRFEDTAAQLDDAVGLILHRYTRTTKQER